MEENNIKSDAGTDVTSRNVDTIAPTAPGDRTSIASQVAGDTVVAGEPNPEQVSNQEAPSPMTPPNPGSGPEPSFPSSNPNDQAPPFSIAPKKSSGSKIGLIVALAVVLLCGAVVAAYFAFFKPVDKNTIVAEAVEKAIYAEVINFSGGFNMSDNGTDATISFTGAIDAQNHVKLQLDVSAKQNSNSINLQGQAIVNNGDVYIKLDGVREAASSMLGEYLPEYSSGENFYMSYITSFVNKIDGEWIKITADDLKTIGIDITACTTSYTATLRNDLIAAYKNNSFVIVGDELGERDGSIGYRISIDQSKSQAFSRAISSSSSVSSLDSCMGSSGLLTSFISDGSSSGTSTPNVNAEIWINKTSHEITNLQLNTAIDNGSVTIKFSTKNKGVIDIQIPSSYMTFTEVSSDLQAAILGLMSSYSYESDYDYDTDFDFDDSDSTLECTPENGCTIVE